MKKPKILDTTWPYFQKVLGYHNLKISPTYHDPGIWGGDQVKIEGYPEYNFLLDINHCLSSRPSGQVRDRTNSIRFPFLIESSSTWTAPVGKMDLDTCFEMRVNDIETKFSTVNLCWSGGIDSTAMVVAWLKHAKKTTKIRILYSIDSIKENANFFLYLQTIKNLDLVEMGGKVFYQNNLDGIEVHGGAADDLTASIDESFFETHGWWTLQSPWKTFFWKKIPDQSFIDFCEKWFAFSGLEIKTVLQARWWFYFNKCKPSGRCNIIANDTDLRVSFYNHKLFDDYFSQNIDKLFYSSSWKSYKQSQKDYIHAYYPDDDYRQNKCKKNSGGYMIFSNKKQLIKKQEKIMELADGTSIQTNNLPFLSQHEYRGKYQDQLNYLFHK
jgi:hypothetical protein